MDEHVTSLFQPDTLLPDQFLETYRRKQPLEPEKKLMLALLEDAVACFQKFQHARDSKGRALFREAEEWFFSDQSKGVFSFENTCDFLGFDHRYLRRGLIQWRQQGRSPKPAATVRPPQPPPKRVPRRSARSGRGPKRRLRRAVGRR
jgi:hypothetical protein